MLLSMLLHSYNKKKTHFQAGEKKDISPRKNGMADYHAIGSRLHVLDVHFFVNNSNIPQY